MYPMVNGTCNLGDFALWSLLANGYTGVGAAPTVTGNHGICFALPAQQSD